MDIQTKQDPRYLDRDLQWLEFNYRVLVEASNKDHLLLDRLSFLSIYTSNLDEFFMKRVLRHHLRVETGSSTTNEQGLLPVEMLSRFCARVTELYEEQNTLFHQLKTQLAQSGVLLLEWKQINKADREFCRKHFIEAVFPILTPITVDPGHPFPFISNLSTSLGVVLQKEHDDEKVFTRIKIPKNAAQWVKLPQIDQSREQRFVHLIDVIRDNLSEMFPDSKVLDVVPFRVTRNADIQWDDGESEAEDLLELVSEELKQRRFGQVVRLEVLGNSDPWVLNLILDELEITKDKVYHLKDQLDYTDLRCILDIKNSDLKQPSWTPIVPKNLSDDKRDFFQIIKTQDFIVHHPYESFDVSVERFVEMAASDPHVLAIKMTVYRTGEQSPFIPILIKAAEAGKQVVCLVELKARFDEERNIYWARKLEDAGVHVVYGLIGLKTHAKLTLVVRQESEGIRSYVHLGTGNYNKVTARLYDDFGVFTSDSDVTTDAVQLFHYLTSGAKGRDYKKLLVAPLNMQSTFLDLIHEQAALAKKKKKARIIAKCNGLDDHEIIEALYEASQAGVQIDLIVRGACSLIPQKKGLSENIRVKSVIGRFLEHSRVFYFSDGQKDPLQGRFYIGSADWMERNMKARVETALLIDQHHLKLRIWETLNALIEDDYSGWLMDQHGRYHLERSLKERGTHNRLIAVTKERELQSS